VIHLRLELGKFLSRLFPYALGGRSKKGFPKEQEAPEAKVFACYLYHLQGPSFRQAKRLLKDLELEFFNNSTTIYRSVEVRKTLWGRDFLIST